MHIASAATSVKFHEFPSGAVIYNYQPGTRIDGPIRSISWSKDGNWLAVVPYSGLTEIVSIKNNLNLMHTIQYVTEPSCAAFQNGTKKHIALGTKNGQVLLYDIKSRGVKKRFPRTTSEITRIEFTAKDTHILTSTGSGDILLYSNISNNLSSTLRVPKSESVSALRTNPTKRNSFIAGSNEGVVAVWDINNNKVKFFSGAHNAPVASVTFSPINADLILTSGLDRQCCFFDTETKQRIAVIPVDNNIISADFSRDGIHFILGSQNGIVYIHDSRKIQNPIQQFEAHNSSVKHLLFQKYEDGDSSLINIKSDTLLPKTTESLTQADISESYGLYMETSENSNQPSKTSPTSKTKEAEDSFMAALGLDLDNSIDSPRCEVDNKTLDISKQICEPQPVLNDTPCIPTSIVSASKLTFLREDAAPSVVAVKQSASTPKLAQEELVATISPIVAQKEEITQSSENVEELEKVIARTMKTEMAKLREEVTNMTNNVDFQVRSVASQIRRMSLDLQMTMVREFIKFENGLNDLKEDIGKECVGLEVPRCDQFLMEENMRLKKKISELEEQLANNFIEEKDEFS